MPYNSREKNAARSRRYRRQHPELRERERLRHKRLIARRREFINQYKIKRGCSRCGERDPVVLDLHHEGTKELSISDACGYSWSLARLLEELDKCIVLCANCHKKAHFSDTDNERLNWLRDYKQSRGCEICEEDDPRCLVFHHDTGEKIIGISEASAWLKWSQERILAEISKCKLLCSNCHRRLHHVGRSESANSVISPFERWFQPSFLTEPGG